MEHIVNVKIKFTCLGPTAAEIELQKCGLGKKSWNHQILQVKINFTVDFEPIAAEIKQIVKLKINFTIDFEATAAEIEQIVKLIENIKRNYNISF